jgi:hypothetical protein
MPRKRARSDTAIPLGGMPVPPPPHSEALEAELAALEAMLPTEEDEVTNPPPPGAEGEVREN